MSAAWCIDSILFNPCTEKELSCTSVQVYDCLVNIQGFNSRALTIQISCDTSRSVAIPKGQELINRLRNDIFLLLLF